jgi:hypothetical protein
MKVICINNSDILNGLTIDKTYEVVENCQGMYYIKDNSGEERWYYYSRFKDISTIREEKLKQLGI